MEYSRYSRDMSFSEFGHPVFDCDFHLYEGADAFTRYLPQAHKGLLRLAEIDGRTKMIIRGKVSDYIPNPTFSVVAEPGSAAEYFSGRNFEGKSYRDIVTPMKAIPEFTDHPKVINGCSDLFVEVLGEAGKHARSAVGMGSLPMGIPVEIECIVEVE